MFKIFIGYDGREKIAYDVLKFTIEKYTNSDIKIIPLYHKNLREQGYFMRPWITEATSGNMIDLLDGKPFSTEFSHTRFLIPEIMNFNGWALFMDCDMLFRCNVKEIFSLANERYAVMCVKHNQKIKESKKMDGSPQQSYYRKNWSSFMLMNCGHKLNRELTKERVNTASGSWLHRFDWLPDEAIGELPDCYNWIEGTSRAMDYPKVIHYTLGGPWFDGYKDVMYAQLWEEQYKQICEMIPDPAGEIAKVNYRNV